MKKFLSFKIIAMMLFIFTHFNVNASNSRKIQDMKYEKALNTCVHNLYKFSEKKLKYIDYKNEHETECYDYASVISNKGPKLIDTSKPIKDSLPYYNYASSFSNHFAHYGKVDPDLYQEYLDEINRIASNFNSLFFHRNFEDLKNKYPSTFLNSYVYSRIFNEMSKSLYLYETEDSYESEEKIIYEPLDVTSQLLLLKLKINTDKATIDFLEKNFLNEDLSNFNYMINTYKLIIINEYFNSYVYKKYSAYYEDRKEKDYIEVLYSPYIFYEPYINK